VSRPKEIQLERRLTERPERREDHHKRKYSAGLDLVGTQATL